MTTIEDLARHVHPDNIPIAAVTWIIVHSTAFLFSASPVSTQDRYNSHALLEYCTLTSTPAGAQLGRVASRPYLTSTGSVTCPPDSAMISSTRIATLRP